MPKAVRLFLREALRHPRQVSAFAPSSPGLARQMAVGLGKHSGPVVEFGPGTGQLTKAILAAGVAPQNLTLLEWNPDFVAYLRARFPGVTVINAPAQHAPDLMQPVACRVISGLPLLSMAPALREDIIAAAFRVLAPGGEMAQFTYGTNTPLTPKQLDRLGLTVERGKRVWANLPPARILWFRRIADTFGMQKYAD